MYSDLFFLTQVNHVELSPKYAGTLMGITNTAANMAGFAAPQLTGVVIHENVRYIFQSFTLFEHYSKFRSLNFGIFHQFLSY